MPTGSLTNYAEAIVGAYLFGSGSWNLSGYPSLYVTLGTGADVEGGSFQELTARVPIARAQSSWSAPMLNSRLFTNAQAVTFVNPMPATHFALFYAADGGAALCMAPLEEPGVGVEFGPGALAIGFSGAWSDYLAQAVGNHLLCGVPFLPPNTLYAALLVAGNEVSGGGYARVACPIGNWTALDHADARFANDHPLIWPAPTGAWGTVSDVVLYDAATGGNEWCRVSRMSFEIGADAPTPIIAAGALVATIG